jgi:gluconate kinase
MEARAHFMPATLLDSQFATLEDPSEAERPIRVDVRHSPTDCAALVLKELKRRHDEKNKVIVRNQG